MRQVAAIACLLALLASGSTAAEKEVDRPYDKGGPLAWWTFNEGAGTQAADSSGNGLTSTLKSQYGNPESRWRADGQLGSALDFTDGYWVEMPNDARLAIADRITISAWVQASSPGENSFMRIVSKKETSESASGYELVYNLSSGVLDLLGGGADFARAEDVWIGDGAWHHVAATANGTQARIYVDGVDRTTDGTIGRITAGPTRLEIGRRTGTLFTWWYRSIDDLRLFDRTLTADDVRYLFNDGKEKKAKKPKQEKQQNPPVGKG